MRAPNVFTISPALPFLETFVDALLRGDVVRDFCPGDDPLALATATIYVPTQRSARALSRVFLQRGGQASVLLPRILPLGALEATETPLLFAEPEPSAPGLPLPRAAEPLWRRLRLAALIQRWAKALEGALRGVKPDGTPVIDDNEAFRVATSTVDAFHLAGDLANLIDELRIEDVAWRDLDPLSLPEFDDYWRITTTFLSIAVTEWPKILAEKGVIDPAERQIKLVEAQAAALAGPAATLGGPAAGPVLAIGSTGTNKATARLLAAIARAAQGAVVLPGLDRDLDIGAWDIISGALREDQEPSFGHPQAALARLLPVLGIARADVQPIGTASEAQTLRAQFVAEALRPADTTDLWQAYRAAQPGPGLTEALAGLTLIEAADEREEAACLAIALREVLEIPGRTAALITPDRDLARRVRGELLRWNIEVTDTGGDPLSSRPPGILASLTAALAGTWTARSISALLAHPLTSFGGARSEIARLASLIEVAVLRAVPLGGKTTAGIFASAQLAARDHHAHPAQSGITPQEWETMLALWQRLADALSPLRQLEGSHLLTAWVAAHRAALDALTGGLSGEDGAALGALFDELAGADDAGLAFTAESYGVFFARVAAEISLRTASKPHPRLEILGLLEARLMRADVMLLGGLDETVWPPQARTDPFLNRPMRRELGLTPPERRLGQTAHDFTQALGAERVIMSRAAKRGGSPCVPSRFLLRLEALGADHWRDVKTRGAAYPALARALDQPLAAPKPAARPRPTPPVALRPRQLSVTQIETLRRDPYAIFAAKILRLTPLPRANEDLDASLFGLLAHQTLHEFTRDCPPAGNLETRRARLHELLRKTFAAAFADPVFAAFRWPALVAAMEVFLTFDSQARETLQESLTECDGFLELPLADGSIFKLTARADRIDRHRSGAVTLIDYKTGQPPGITEVQAGFAPQLTLEAAMAKRGCFGLPRNSNVNALYVKLGGKNGGSIRDLAFKDAGLDEIAEQHLDGMLSLLSSFREEQTGYLARPYPKYARAFGDYDHLARVKEWLLSGAGEAEA